MIPKWAVRVGERGPIDEDEVIKDGDRWYDDNLPGPTPGAYCRDSVGSTPMKFLRLVDPNNTNQWPYRRNHEAKRTCSINPVASIPLPLP
jgi:hypothetical protein